MSNEGRIVDFLAGQGLAKAAMTMLAGDASARRYWRLVEAGSGTHIVMDASATGDLASFRLVAGLLADLGLAVPEIRAVDPAAGLALIEDFGDALFADLWAGGQPPEPLFDLAVDVLIALHRRFEPASAPALPRYDAALFLAQLELFLEQMEVTSEAAQGAFSGLWAELLATATGVPSSLLHRDYHAGNLVRREGEAGIAACGILDFQDAGLGPITYDLASLVEDARRDVTPALRRRAVARYLAAFPAIEAAGFERSLAILALMRHLRVVAIFLRLARCGGKTGYLVHLPRLWRLIEGHLARPECAALRDWFDANVAPPRYSEPG